MADRDISVQVAATTEDLISLAECKTLLGIAQLDTSRDAQLQMQISIASAMAADLANRKPNLGFGEKTLIEQWRQVGNGRLLLMHWPIKDPAGILNVTAGAAPVIAGVGGYRLDGPSGKLSVAANGGSGGTIWLQPVIVHYIGGYKLPTEAPLPLKQACAILVQEQRIRNVQAQTAGIRLLSHKDSRVAFYDPNALLLKSIGAKSIGMQAAEALIRPYIRIEV
jgi:hypothetical protein